MIRAGALYFAIVIAFFIAVMSAVVIMLASHYRNTYLKQIRYAKLFNNLNSGITGALSDQSFATGRETFDLYGEQADSVTLTKKVWGIFDMATVKSYIGRDTLSKAFLIGKETDSTVLFLSDEDRPISVSGDTKVTGKAALPRSGIKKSYVDGKPYAHDRTIFGPTVFSERALKPLDQTVLTNITDELAADLEQLPLFEVSSLDQSFHKETIKLRLPKNARIDQVVLKGNVILYGDSIVTISSGAKLSGIQVYAPTIRVERGFNGDCQLFASDSIVVDSNAVFSYPSVLGLIRKKAAELQPTIALGNNTDFSGIIFTHEKDRTPLQTLVKIGRGSRIKGEVYVAGLVRFEQGLKIDGKISCNRFLMQTKTTLYENFLINVYFNRYARNRYYLSSRLFNTSNNKVLKWLN